MAVLLKVSDLRRDPRYQAEGIPDKKVCRRCTREKTKYHFHIYLKHTKHQGQKLRLAYACRLCISKYNKGRKNPERKREFVSSTIMRPIVYALYEHFGSFSKTAKGTGVPQATILMSLERTGMRPDNADKLRAVFEDVTAGMSDEVVAELSSRGRERHETNLRRRELRLQADDEAGLRTCIHCETPKFIEEFKQPQKRGRKQRHHFTCLSCERDLRSVRNGADPESRFVPVTPEFRRLTERMAQTYTRKQLHARGIWDTTYAAIVNGERSKVTIRTARRILTVMQEHANLT